MKLVWNMSFSPTQNGQCCLINSSTCCSKCDTDICHQYSHLMWNRSFLTLRILGTLFTDFNAFWLLSEPDVIIFGRHGAYNRHRTLRNRKPKDLNTAVCWMYAEMWCSTGSCSWTFITSVMLVGVIEEHSVSFYFSADDNSLYFSYDTKLPVKQISTWLLQILMTCTSSCINHWNYNQHKYDAHSCF